MFIMNTMELMHIFFIFSVDFLSVMVETGKPDSPKDIRINVIGRTANISWTIPSSIQNKKSEWSRINIKESTGGDIVVNLKDNRTVKDITVPISSFEINNLKMCSEYIVTIRFLSSISKFTSKKFWMTNELKPPENVKINVIGETANISWTNAKSQEINTSVISLFDSKGDKVAIDSSKYYKYVKFPVTSCVIVNLMLCSEYVVNIEYISRGVWSGATEQKFWMTSNTINADPNEDVALAWTTHRSDFFKVFTPLMYIIYNVQGSIIPNSQSTKYKYDISTTDFQTINITIINVNETDAGLYITKEDNTDGCCLLVVTAKPMKPTLTLNTEHPFVGDNITLTCHSMVQRWPTGYMTSHLSYQFNGSPRGVSVNNKLTIHSLTMSDEGKNISCQATDDLQKASIKSDAITLDPYYGPDNIVLKPGNTALNITKGSILGPISCTVTCYPKCLFEWRLNRTGTFEDVLSSEILVVASIKENQAGIYRCLVVHPSNKTRLRRTDISVNVQYSPKIESLWLSDKNETYGSGRPPTYNFSEGNHLTIILRIKSNPDPHIVIYSSLLKFSTLNFTKQYNDFSTKLPSFKCENSGNFTIHASNGIAYGDNRTVNLKIKCKPRDVNTKRKIGTKVKTDVNIVMDVISFPAPNVTWLRMSTLPWTVRKDKYDYKHNLNSTIRISSIDDFREYGIKICNTLGCIVENITLQPEDKPEAPLNFSLETTTFRSANLSWIVGFNGGDTQTFSVQFKASDGDGDTNSVQTSEPKTGSKVYYILDQLKPDTWYDVMVFSTNKYGNRNASLKFKTEVKPTVKSPSKSASMTPIFIGIGCGIAVILITVIFLYMFFNRRNKRSTSEPTESNVLYAAVDKVQQKFKRRNAEQREYEAKNEDTNMSNEPANAEYASVVKPKSKSKKVHYKEDEIETANDEYAVVDKSNRKIKFTDDDTTYANQGDADLLIRQPSKKMPSGRKFLYEISLVMIKKQVGKEIDTISSHCHFDSLLNNTSSKREKYVVNQEIKHLYIRKNQDGLTYIEVSFARKPKDRRRIIGAENRTNYVDIDFSRTADPLPETADE